MRTATLLGISALAGGIAGGTAGFTVTNAVAEWAQSIHRADIQCLESGHKLPPIEEPPEVARKPRNAFLVVLPGPLGGGVLGFVAVALFVQLVASVAPDATAFDRIAGALFFGLFGFFGGALLGVLAGILLYFLELRARTSALKLVLRRSVWEQREQLRADLAIGKVSPNDAIVELENAIAA